MPRVAKIIAYLLLGFLGPLVSAHDPGLSSANLLVFPNRIELVTTFAGSDARWLTPEETKSADINSPVFREAVEKAAQDLWQIQSAGAHLSPTSPELSSAPGNNIAVTQTFGAPAVG